MEAGNHTEMCTRAEEKIDDRIIILHVEERAVKKEDGKVIKPILFNTEMVRAILDGRKKNTRRVIKFPRNRFTGEIPKPDDIKIYSPLVFSDKISFHVKPFYRFDMKVPYERGDFLYIRETWGISNLDYDDKITYIVYKASENEKDGGCRIVRLPDDKFEKLYDSMAENSPQWRPSIHMPKEAARIFLRVTDVRVERLQDITDAEAEREGAQPQNPFDYDVNKWPNKEHFKEIWNSTIKKSDFECYGWEVNPWVWAYEFEECGKPEEWII